jgi:hypothetical protein
MCKQFIMFLFEALGFRRFLRGFDRVNLHRPTTKDRMTTAGLSSVMTEIIHPRNSVAPLPKGLLHIARHVIDSQLEPTCLEATGIERVVFRVQWHPMTWRAMCARPHLAHAHVADEVEDGDVRRPAGPHTEGLGFRV